MLVAISLTATGCSIEDIPADEPKEPQEIPAPAVNDITAGGYCPGIMTVKLTDEPESTEAVEALLSEAVNVKSVRPVFPDDPRYTERHRASGLHLWFTVEYDGGKSPTRAAGDISMLPGIELAEGLPVAQSTAAYFNDPMLYRQWHYINTAQQSGYVSGADINLSEAWDFTTGSPEVIVAVLDCGVRYTHEDLRDNMWVNEAELNGKPGIDDDGNGYVDDIYGYNFCYVESYSKMHGKIVPEDHGSHTAGTIAAVNNNSKGGCGIAGGDGMHKGARIMTCQIIQEKNPTENWPSDLAAAFVYAADNGAVISNNSWSSEHSSAVRRAIQYFNDYAGCDKNGAQLPGSPMKGGVAFFASGNENSTAGYPAMYSEAFAVASVGPDFKRAYYSNYGSWVDICAPGGDQQAFGIVNGGVYSCTSGSDSSYDYYQGTSMACPHVTGAAALALSVFGGDGFTRDGLINILEEAANPDVYNYNMSYKGQLGAGLLDAGAMFAANRPQPVTDLTVTADKNTITLSWTIPEADAGHRIASFVISINGEDIIFETSAQTGEKIRYVFRDLEFDTLYSFTVRAYNEEGVPSKISPAAEIRTEPNKAPSITPLDGTAVTLGRNVTKKMRFSVHDAEDDSWTCSITGKTHGLGCARIDGSTMEIEFRGTAIYGNSGEGTFTAALHVADEFGNTSVLEITYTVLNHLSPMLKMTFEDRIIAGVGNRMYLTLSDYFEADASFMVNVEMDNEVASWFDDSGVLRLTSRKAGDAQVTVRITDKYNESAEGKFRLAVSAGTGKADIYPATVTSVFYVRTTVQNDINVRLVSQSGQTVLNNDYKGVGPFSPATVNVPASCAPGAYTAIVRLADGTQVKQTIIKL